MMNKPSPPNEEDETLEDDPFAVLVEWNGLADGLAYAEKSNQSQTKIIQPRA